MIALAVAVWYGVAWLRRGPPLSSTLVIAHRGSPADARIGENTVPAFEAAIASGADGLEFDVRRTRDGGLVVMHDATVDRTTDGSGAVADLTLAQIRGLTAGDGARVPTVDEVLSLAAQAGVAVFPEIKDGAANPGIAASLVETLRNHDLLGKATILSFEPATLAELASIAPQVRTCWLTGFGSFDLAAPPADVAAVCPMAEMVLVAPDVVRQVHAAGRGVIAWWGAAESAAGNAALAGFGVDGIIVDDLAGVP